MSRFQALLVAGVLSFAAGVLVDGTARDSQLPAPCSELQIPPIPAAVRSLPVDQALKVCQHYAAIGEAWKCVRVQS
jgi:hypothetical protein